MGFEKWFKDYLSRIDGTETLKEMLRISFMNGYELGIEDYTARAEIDAKKNAKEIQCKVK